jgi:hypothetical protein
MKDSTRDQQPGGIAMNKSDKTRRKLTKSAAVARTSTLVVAPNAQTADGRTKEEEKDRQRVLECGMTEAEADCWELVARAAGKFFQLPKLHPMDDQEVAQAIHVIQHKLLSRPTYRKYLALAKGEGRDSRTR